jgi:hypothetical protein
VPTITVDVRDFKKLGLLLKDISDKTLRQASARSISRTITTIRKDAVKEFRSSKLISMKSSTMKKRIRAFNHAKSNQPVNSQFGEVTISGKPESMSRFFAHLNATTSKHGQTLYGVTVSALGKEYMEGKDSSAFFMKRNGQLVNAVFARSSNKRLPIQKLTGPSLGKIAQDHGMLTGLGATAQRRYSTEFEHNLKFYADLAVRRASGSK